MARTTPDKVKAIIETDEDIDLEPFIVAANELVTEICAKPEYSLSTQRLELIETWLAAHFYTVYDPRTIQENVGSATAMYQSKVGFGLNVSHYGQMALRLDTSGALAAYENAMTKVMPDKLPVETRFKKKTIKWLGS